MDVKTLPTHPFTGLTAIGLTSRGPVWPVAGGSAPVGGGDEPDADDDETDEDPEGDGDEGDEETEPVVDWKAKFDEQQAALEASQAKLQRARAQAKALREKAEATTPPAPTPTPRPRQQAAKPDPEPQVVTVQDTEEVERWQAKAVRASAMSALIGRGCDPDLVDAPLSRLRVGEIDWDEDEPILDEYLDAMEEKYPKLFKQPEPVAPVRSGGVRRAGSIDQGAAGGTGQGRPAPREVPFGQKLWESGQGDIRAPRRGR